MNSNQTPGDRRPQPPGDGGDFENLREPRPLVAQFIRGLCPRCGAALKVAVGGPATCQNCNAKLRVGPRPADRALADPPGRPLHDRAAAERDTAVPDSAVPPTAEVAATPGGPDAAYPADSPQLRWDICPMCKEHIKVASGIAGTCEHCHTPIVPRAVDAAIVEEPTGVYFRGAPASRQEVWWRSASEDGRVLSARARFQNAARTVFRLKTVSIVTGCAAIVAILIAIVVVWNGRDDAGAAHVDARIESRKGDVLTNTGDVTAPVIGVTQPVATQEPTPAAARSTVTVTERPLPAFPSSHYRSEWAFTVPAGHSVSIDGIPLVADGQIAKPCTVVLPLGTHFIVVGAESRSTVTVRKAFLADYQLRSAEFTHNDAYDFDRLVHRSAASSGVFTDPILAHLWGNYYWQQDEPEAAIRGWNEALRINPTFAPAHLNLAFAFSKARRNERAAAELQLAFHFNHHDCFGIAAHVEELSGSMRLERIDGIPRMRPEDYEDLQNVETLSSEQLQVLNTLETIRAYVTTAAQRIRVSNNKGAYLLHEGMPLSAQSHLRSALQEISEVREAQQDHELVTTVLANLAESARQAEMVEAAYYEALSQAVSLQGAVAE